MKTLAFYLALLLITGYHLANACQCPLSSLSLKECDRYEVILRGKILHVKTCDDRPGEALFEVQELYKGNAFKKFKVLFNCNEECAYPFQIGEEWILYSRYKQVNTAIMDWCSRSRRFFRNPKEDYYTSTYGNDYEEELAFLRQNLGLHRLIKEDSSVDVSRNQIPDKQQSVILLLCSLAGIVLFYLIFKRFYR